MSWGKPAFVMVALLVAFVATLTGPPAVVASDRAHCLA